MRYLFNLNFTFLVLIFSCSTAIYGQDCFLDTETGQYLDSQGNPCINPLISAVPFLRINPDARTGGLGDGGLALSADANTMHLNASRMAFSEKSIAVSGTYVPWLRALSVDDTYLAYLSGYRKLDEFQAVGVSLRYFSLGSINFTDSEGNPQGSGNPNELEFAVAYARKLTDNLSVAVTLKYIYSNLASGQEVNGRTISSGNAFASDLSFTYKKPIDLGATNSELSIGLAVTNIGTKISYTTDNKEFLPANIGLGIGWKFYFDEYNSITFIGDVNKYLIPTPPLDGTDDFKDQSTISAIFGSFGDAPNGGSEEIRELYYSFGAEYFYNDQFGLRAGYFYEHPSKGGRKFATVGLGLKYNVIALNLSYLIPTSSNRNPLDNTLRFAVSYEIE